MGLWLLALLTWQDAPVRPFAARVVTSESEELQAYDAAGSLGLKIAVGPHDEVQVGSSGGRVLFMNGSALKVTAFRLPPKIVDVAKEARGAKWSPATPQVAFLSGKSLQVFDAGLPTEPPREIAADATAFAWAADGRRMMTFTPSGKGGAIHVRSLDGGKPRLIMEGHAATSLAWAPDGRTFAFIKPELGKPDLGNLIIGVVGSSSLKRVAAGVSGDLTFSPDSRKILVEGSKNVVASVAGTTPVNVPSTGTSRIHWATATRLQAFFNGAIQELDLNQDSLKFQLRLAIPGGRRGFLAPSLSITNLGQVQDPFREAPGPIAGSINLRGYVDDKDPLEDRLTIQVQLVRRADGTEQFFSRPIPVKVELNDNSIQLGDGRKLRPQDVPFDQELELCVTASNLVSNQVYPVRWAYMPTWTNEAFEFDARFPQLKPPLNFVWRQAVDASVKVPLVFPLVGRYRLSDWWLAPRGGGTRKHIGQDIMADKMTPMVACFDGRVSFGRGLGNAGHTVTVSNRSGWTAQYYHVNNDTPGTDDGAGGDFFAFAPGLLNGDSVVAGQLLGWVGDSGNAESTGPHIHFELWYEPQRAVVNAYASLKAARVLTAPRYPDPAPGLKPAAGEVRTDGLLLSVDASVRTLRMSKTGELNGKGRLLGIEQPSILTVDFSEAMIRARGNSQSLTLADLRPGLMISVLTPAPGPMRARVLALQAR